MLNIHRYYAEYVDELPDVSVMECKDSKVLNICFVGDIEQYFVWCGAKKEWVQLQFLQAIERMWLNE